MSVIIAHWTALHHDIVAYGLEGIQFTFHSSSTVELSAVNRWVAGSNPAGGASFQHRKITIRIGFTKYNRNVVNRDAC